MSPSIKLDRCYSKNANVAFDSKPRFNFALETKERHMKKFPYIQVLREKFQDDLEELQKKTENERLKLKAREVEGVPVAVNLPPPPIQGASLISFKVAKLN
jgi:hypothetical protein